jgi:hypothetical protein
MVVFFIDTTNCVLSSNVATRFDKLYDYPQATLAHICKTNITIANFIVAQNEISVCEKCI